jgi:hypothetical protein
MDLQKAKITLEKINALYKNMSADARNVSSIEKDLMRSYIQQLYEHFIEMPQAAPAPPVQPFDVVKTVPKAPAYTPPPPAHRKPAAAKEVEPAPPPKAEEPPKPAPAPPPPPPPTPPKVEPEPPAPAHPQPLAPRADQAELEELFAVTSARELSEKLGELPIADIKKAMGLNERIFTVNELFGGDQAAFDETLSNLNFMPGFEAAKNFLINGVASKYNWASKDKKSKAKTFIKLVKRRYN